MEGKIIIVPKARPAVDFASNLLVILKDDVDEYVKEIDKHHVDFIRSLESSWRIRADGMAVETAKMVKEKYEEIIAKKDKEIAELKEERRWRKCSDEMPQKYDDGDCFLIAVEHESTTSPKRYYVTIAELVDGSWSDDEGEDIDEDIEYDIEDSIFRSQAPKGAKKGFYRSKVTHWMPLQSAPKEAK